MQSSLSLILMSSSKVQGLFFRGSHKFFGNYGFFNLLVSSTSYYTGETTKNCFNFTISEGVDMKKRKRQIKYIILRWEIKEQLRSLRSVIGLYSTHGLRNKKPKMNEVKTIRPGRTINIVVGSSLTELIPFRLYSNRRGINLMFDKDGDQHCVLIVRYQGLSISQNRVLDLNDNYVSQIVQRVRSRYEIKGERSQVLVLGAMFN